MQYILEGGCRVPFQAAGTTSNNESSHTRGAATPGEQQSRGGQVPLWSGVAYDSRALDDLSSPRTSNLIKPEPNA